MVGQELVAIDFETYLISPEETVPRPVCLSWFDGTTKGLIVGKHNISSFLKEQFEQRKTFIAHNATFELLVIYTHFPELRSYLTLSLDRHRFICTMIYRQMLNNSTATNLMRLGLDSLVQHYFKVDISEDKKAPDAWRLRYSELDGVPLEQWPDKAKDYAIQDSVWAYKLFEVLDREDKTWPEMKNMVGWNTAVSFYLNKMGDTGILVDQDKVLELEQALKEFLEPRRAKLLELGMATVSKSGKFTKNIAKLRQYVETLPLVPIKTPSGGISLTGEAIEAYLGDVPNDEILKTFIEISEFEKAETAYLPRLKAANPVIRSQYDVVKATGRTSCRTSDHFPSLNIQQLPRQLKGMPVDIRGCLKAREGHKFISIDYGGLELACVSHQLSLISAISPFRDDWNKGDKPADMHSVLGATLMQMSEKRTVTLQEFMANKKDPVYARYRQLAKPIVLGRPGGIGYDKIRSQMVKEGIYPYIKEHTRFTSEYDAKVAYTYFCDKYDEIRVKRVGPREWALVTDEIVGITKALFTLYPDLKDFLRERHSEFQNGAKKWVKNDWGEWEEEPMYAYQLKTMRRNDCTYTSFCNGYLMQALSAEGAKTMVMNVSKRYLGSEDVRLLGFIHDEIICEVKDNEQLHDNVRDICSIMIDSMQEVLYNSRISVEASCMEHWQKSGGDWDKTYWKNVGDKKLYE